MGRVTELEPISSPQVGCRSVTSSLGQQHVQSGHDKQLSPGSSGAWDGCLPALS